MNAPVKIISFLFSLLLVCSLSFVSQAQRPKNTKTNPSKNATPKPSPTPSAEEDAVDQQKLDEIVALKDLNEQNENLRLFIEERPNSNLKPLASDLLVLNEIGAITDLNERIEKLKTFLQERPETKLKSKALELLSSTRAVLGDERLRYGDSVNGVEQFRLAVSDAPENSTDLFFDRVLSQIPSNLFWRNEQKAALEIAKLIEEKINTNATRLLALEAFYLGIEDSANAVRLAQMAVKLAPDMPAAHQGLGAAYRISFMLDESAEAYAKAAELDQNSAVARRSLADMRRAQGRDEEALLIYRSLLQADKEDEFSRTGLIMSLFDLGKREEAEKELSTALEMNPNSFGLLTNAAYWYAANNEGEKAVETARKAIQIESRYVWAHVALARGLIATKKPLEAERTLLYARQYGSFPTLDYELATVLVSAGLYEEATRTLSRSFTIKDGMIETRLGGRASAKAENFIELLSPERRASIFQANTADTETNAKLLKNLLVFSKALNPENKETRKEEDVVAAAKEFTAGSDAMRTYRQLYAASRLIQNDVALGQAFELTQAATSGVEASLDVPVPALAVMADELFEVRARAATYGSTANIPNVQRNTLSNIMRGRIEDIAGWSLFNQKKPDEAVIRLKRAISVLPENSVWWRSAMWHLGAAYEASGSQQEALTAYYKSYNSNPDASRRSIIEALYQRVNGSLEGLDNKIGPSPFAPPKAGMGNDAKLTNTVASINTTPTETNSNENSQTTSTPNPSADTSTQKTETQTENTEAKPSTTPEKTETNNSLPANNGPDLLVSQKTKSNSLPEIKLKPLQKPEQTPPPSLVENKTEPSVSPSPTNETKTETKPESEETKVEKKSETKTENTETKPEIKPETEESKVETKPENEVTKPENNETKVETKSENVENKPETKSETKSDPTLPTIEENKPSSNEVKKEEPDTSNEKKEEAIPTPSPSPSPSKEEEKPSKSPSQKEEKPSEEQVAKVDTKPNETTQPASTEEKTESKKENEENKTEAVTENKSENKTEDVTESKTEKPSLRPRVVKEKSDDTSGNQTESKTEDTPKQDEVEKKQVRPRVIPSSNEETKTETEKQPSAIETKQTDETTNPKTNTCTVSVTQEEISILNDGGTIAITLMFDGMPFEAKKVSLKFDWANINVFLEQDAKTDERSALYKIISVSKKTGEYKITFTTPCGSKEVLVKVR